MKKKTNQQTLNCRLLYISRHLLIDHFVTAPSEEMSVKSKPMKVAIISARYMDQHAIESYLVQIFGYNVVYVTVSLKIAHNDRIA